MKASLTLSSSLLIFLTSCESYNPDYDPGPLTEADAKEYKLDPKFYKKVAKVQNILIASSDKVSDNAHRETAYLFDLMLKNTRADIAQRVSDNAVLCILVAWNELTSEVPQFTTKKTGKEEDILEYEGGMQRKSILVHEFGHVIHKAGFDEPLEKKLIKSFESSMKNKFWPDGRAAQRFRRVKSATPVSLLTALTKSLPDISEKLLIQCLDNGDTLVNGKRSFAEVKITVNDKVLIVFGGEILASEGSLATGGIYLGRCPNLLKRRAS